MQMLAALHRRAPLAGATPPRGLLCVPANQTPPSPSLSALQQAHGGGGQAVADPAAGRGAGVRTLGERHAQRGGRAGAGGQVCPVRRAALCSAGWGNSMHGERQMMNG